MINIISGQLIAFSGILRFGEMSMTPKPIIPYFGYTKLLQKIQEIHHRFSEIIFGMMIICIRFLNLWGLVDYKPTKMQLRYIEIQTFGNSKTC